jgi:threonyl-tRNA synthetase
MGVRVDVDARSETVNQKIRQAQLNKIPYMLVIGDKEIAASTVSVRLRTGEQLASQSFDNFKSNLMAIIGNKEKDLKL